MTNQLTFSIVRILAANGKVTGGGFLVGEKRVLTCADMVAQALGIAPDVEAIPAGEVGLDFPFIAPGRTVKAKVVFWQPAKPGAAASPTGGENIAVLELERTSPRPQPHLYAGPTETHYDQVMDAITQGELVPFLGAGVNLCGRPEGKSWELGLYLPSGTELAAHLAKEFSYPLDEVQDLVRVSQYVALTRGSGPLYRQLRRVFDADYPPTPLHEFLATLPAILREKGYPPYQLIVTTNYDDVLERAFRAANEPLDIVTYVAESIQGQRGRFLHWLPNGAAKLIDKPNEYTDLSLDADDNLQGAVILKIHGAVDRMTKEAQSRRDSFVITEDQYIDYLTRADVSNLVPVSLAGKLKRSNFLFLGYSLRDWNLRVILHRIWVEQEKNVNYNSWAIQLNPQELDRRFWEKRDVEIINISLEDYVAQLRARALALPKAE
ncbi:MAG TPA: SIR2 family protein [Pyrinomonadaceae bacterium]|nr:SIR2 family protein [Pyrinomonadaceae bacterium]